MLLILFMRTPTSLNFLGLMIMANIKYLNEHLVKKYLSLKPLVTAIEQALSNFSDKKNGGIVQPVRMTLPAKKDDGLYLLMPCYSAKDSTMATKTLSLYLHNHERFNISNHHSIITVFDSSTGTPRGIMDGTYISGYRTAAATAVAIKYLSKPDDSILTVVGTGFQAGCHFDMIPHVKQFKEVRVCGRTLEKVEALSRKYGALGFTSVEEAVSGADVIITCTRSTSPFLCGRWVKQGSLVNVVGACYPTTREVDDELMLSSAVVADTKEGALVQSGDIIGSKCEVVGELGDVINGVLDVDFTKTRLFKSQGIAVEDLVAAKLVLEEYEKDQM